MKRLAFCCQLALVSILLLSVAQVQAGLTYDQEVLADNPLIYYRLNETGVVHTSTANDSSATGLPGTYLIMGGSGGAFTDVAGAYPELSPAKGFDGTHTEIYVPVGTAGGPPALPQFSFEFWMNPDHYNPGFQAIYAANGWGGGRVHLNLNGQNMELAVSGNSTPWGTLTNMPSTAPIGQWSHVVVTYDATAVPGQNVAQFYVNGTLAAQPTTNGATPGNFSVDGFIGSWDGNTRFYDGGLDEMAFYAGILPASRAAAHYNTALGFELVETGGPMSGSNLAAVSAGATPFAKDILGGTHQVSRINDELFGNTNSWIGGSTPSYGGVDFGGAQTIDHIAWGRSNTQSHTDRDEGTYVVEYTQMANSSVNHTTMTTTGDPTTGWATLATTVYDGAWPTTPHLRHLYQFPMVNATGVRIVTQTSGLAIDEIEVYNGHPLTLIETGGTFDTNPMTPNVARGSGATPFASGQWGSNHLTSKLNDGSYGNFDSWIALNGQVDSFAGIDLNGLFPIDRVAWGRSNVTSGDPCAGGVCTDRTGGTYTLQYTQVADPDATTPDGDWTTIGSLLYTDFYQKHLRHEYEFDTVYASGVRLLLHSADPTRLIAIDEIEVYQAVPEPSTCLLAMLGAAVCGLLSLRSRRLRRCQSA